ncbi:MAG: photosynthetic reaction center subunit H [Gammaproteobacteria bacterium]
MSTGSVTSYIDVAQLVLYAFWIFFFGLVFYLRREDKREGYPLESDRRERLDRISVQGFPNPPAPKVFALRDGGTATAPRGKGDTREIRAQPVGPWPGAPLEPTGDPMLDGVGPAAYAERADVPDLTMDGRPKIVPLRVAGDFHLESRDPDPRGMEVIGADRAVGGTVTDVWVDRSETVIRYLELEVPTAGGPRRALLPINFARVDGNRRQVRVKSILARHFGEVPALKNPEQVTLLEEDRIVGYYAGGNLYAEPSRMGPLL